MAHVFAGTGYRSVLSQSEYQAPHETVDHANRNIFRSYRGDQRGKVPHDIFRLRYDVYCVECAFLPPGEQAEGMELDEYELNSVHIAAYAMDETLIGTVRLVQPDAEQPYPFERHCALFEHVELPPRELACEISRLVVRKSHRRRRADSLDGVPGLPPLAPEAERRHGERRGASPMLLFGMYREMYRHSRYSGIRYWYAAMERALAVSLERLGFAFQAIGPAADYYGAVVPYMLDLHLLETKLTADNPALAAWMMERPYALLPPHSWQRNPARHHARAMRKKS
ncbi:PEP-CTERM/exosortase system-associated acyltransferase [Pseudoduganella sp. LjRoot289]|uniref:PEP-CTERM/exosortase system-associated acyltransferase n=1 Tax=Pseudoduganella sp. LjRoot289 TaxID=3342314 RepID=UPI003ECDBDBF